MAARQAKPADMLKIWARAPVLTEDTSTAPDRRERLLEVIGSKMTEDRRDASTLRGWRFAAWAAAAVAACAIGANFAHTKFGGEPTLHGVTGLAHRTHDGRELPVSDGVAVVTFDEIVTASNGRAVLALRSGASITIDPQTTVKLEADSVDGATTDEDIRVQNGLIRVRVPRLMAGGYLSVHTPDAIITVHGTQFSVEVAASTPPITHVAVTEGVVTVSSASSTTRLTAGMSWSSPAPPSARAVATTPAVDAQLVESRATPPVRVAAVTRRQIATQPPADAPKRASSLVAENELFGTAVAARQRGDEAAALKALNQFTASYPTSPLTQLAFVERFRMLAHGSDQGAAGREARRYLTAFPDGFAAEEARSIADRPSPAPTTGP